MVELHTALSLIALVLGIPVTLTLLGRPFPRFWTTSFLALAVATTVTGFFLPFQTLTPAVSTGIVSSLVLILTYVALYVFHLSGRWAQVYAGGVIISVYLLVFVTIAQTFMKVPAVHALAPTLSEPPFQIAQLIALLAFVLLGIKAVRKAKPALTA